MSFVARIPVRFDDVDFARVVYYPRLFMYCHEAFEDFFAARAGVSYADLLGKRNVGFPTVRAEADYFAPLRFGDECRVEMTCVKVGTRSVTHRYRLFRGDLELVCAEMKVVSAAIEMTGFQAMDLPSDLRAVFLRELESSSGPSP